MAAPMRRRRKQKPQDEEERKKTKVLAPKPQTVLPHVALGQ